MGYAGHIMIRPKQSQQAFPPALVFTTIKFDSKLITYVDDVSDLRQVRGFLLVLWFPPSK